MAVLGHAEPRRGSVNRTAWIRLVELESISKRTFVAHESPSGDLSSWQDKLKLNDVSHLDLQKFSIAETPDSLISTV